MSEIKLLPCPFCGGEATLSDSIEDRFAEVHCIECGVKINEKGYPALSKAIKQWNTRKTVERILTRLEELKNAPKRECSYNNGWTECARCAIQEVKEEGGIE